MYTPHINNRLCGYTTYTPWSIHSICTMVDVSCIRGAAYAEQYYDPSCVQLYTSWFSWSWMFWFKDGCSAEIRTLFRFVNPHELLDNILPYFIPIFQRLWPPGYLVHGEVDMTKDMILFRLGTQLTAWSACSCCGKKLVMLPCSLLSHSDFRRHLNL